MFAALIVALGATALVAVGMMTVTLGRSSRLTVGRGVASAALALGVVVAATTGVLALSAQPAQAAAPTISTIDLQLPTR